MLIETPILGINGFLSLFDDVNDEGDIIYRIEGYKGEKINIQDLVNWMEVEQANIFGVSAGLSHLIEKTNIVIIKDGNSNHLVFRLAPFLGLPDISFKEELIELKNLLIFIKEEAIKNSQEKIKLCLDKTEKITFTIICTSEKLEKELNTRFNQDIEKSKILTQWVENQKKGFANIVKNNNNISFLMDSLVLMSLDEQANLLNNKKVNENKGLKTLNSKRNNDKSGIKI